MTQWHCDGRPLGDADLAELGLDDGDAVCEYAGAAFRFSAQTVPARRLGRGGRPGGTVVLSLRQMSGPTRQGAVDVVDNVDVNRFDATRCAGECPLLDAAGETASRAARRYAAVELFHKAEALVGGSQAA
jgi:hypothetical protein